MAADALAICVATKPRIQGQYKAKFVDLDSPDTLILTFTEAGWLISHLHWSLMSHRKRPASP